MCWRGENEVLERCVLSLVSKDEKVGELRIWPGKQFQTVGEMNY